MRYEYDKAIRLTALVNENNANYHFAYDASDRLSEEVRVDNLTNLDGQVISDIERDDLHREVYRTQGKLTSCFGYDAMGRKAWQYASTLPADKLSQVHNAGIHTELYVEHRYNPIHRRYEYDPAGELVRTLDKLRGETRYSYQANGQLHSRDTGSILTSEEFRYDAAGNRLDFNARQFARVTDNRIAKWRNCEYRYDAWGNLIEKLSGPATEQRFEYDCENRLVKAETFVAGKLTATGQYRHDSLGRRTFKESKFGGKFEQKRFLWQGLRMLCESNPEVKLLYLYEPNSYAPLARIDTAEGAKPKTYYFHVDQIGTPLELTDAEGEIVWQANYKAWGEVESLATGQVEQNLRFQGQYVDDETGLHCSTFRYYDPAVGRFLTEDPIGVSGGINLYRYAPNPLVWIDPWGLSCRLDYMGRTPGKSSKTGRKVIERMRGEERIRGDGADLEFKSSDGKWYGIKEADMAHKQDAVTYWNSRGGFFGAKSREVRKWMLDPKNYELEHYSHNRSAGAKLRQFYNEKDFFVGPHGKFKY